MKKIILSADSTLGLYSVPDEVADDLDKYTIDFDTWLFQRLFWLIMIKLKVEQ